MVNAGLSVMEALFYRILQYGKNCNLFKGSIFVVLLLSLYLITGSVSD